jgi:hypothetical protein
MMHWFWRILIPLIVLQLYTILFGIPDPLSTLVFTTIPALLGILIYAGLTWRYGPIRIDPETRCRKCGYILRGISEPRCPECGERI